MVSWGTKQESGLYVSNVSPATLCIWGRVQTREMFIYRRIHPLKKLAALLFAGAAVLGSASVATADPIAVPGVGYAQVNEGGYVVLAEGYDNNGLPVLSGYAYVNDAGRACADDNGNAATGGSSPSCTP